MRLKVGDIVVLWEAGVRRLIVDSRDEIEESGLTSAIGPDNTEHFTCFNLKRNILNCFHPSEANR